MTYEQALTKLEKILADIKSGEMPLSELTKKISEAQELASFCKQCLTKTTEEVDKLLADK